MKYDNKFWINVQDLKTIGFELPKAGTKILWTHFLADTDTHYKIYKEAEKPWSGIWISPFATEIGKRNISLSELFVEFNSYNFIFNNS